jgi:hypothetical protein
MRKAEWVEWAREVLMPEFVKEMEQERVRKELEEKKRRCEEEEADEWRNGLKQKLKKDIE